MIIVKINGGLGNQMFQYALGRHLAEIHQKKLLLDASGLSDPQFNLTPRVYELDAFKNIGADLVQPSQSKALRRSTPFAAWFVEGRFGFHEAILHLPSFPAIGIDGYWQSEKYFKDVASIVRFDFTFRDAIKANDNIMKINSTEAVCVHVRRQDFLSPVGAHYGFVGQQYYDRAVDLMSRQVKDPTFFVFSDDLTWCKDYLSLPGSSNFVERDPNTRAATSLHIMSLCKHFIIANSSFSWWAAWLSSSPHKRVIAPERWFARETLSSIKGGEYMFSSKEIVPENWTRV
jgi:hypothetical protein